MNGGDGKPVRIADGRASFAVKEVLFVALDVFWFGRNKRPVPE